jgi:hypothetical protein
MGRQTGKNTTCPNLKLLPQSGKMKKPDINRSGFKKAFKLGKCGKTFILKGKKSFFVLMASTAILSPL